MFLPSKGVRDSDSAANAPFLVGSVVDIENWNGSYQFLWNKTESDYFSWVNVGFHGPTVDEGQDRDIFLSSMHSDWSVK